MAGRPVFRWRSPRPVLLPACGHRLICREAAAAFPAEACGLLLGSGLQIRRLLPMINQAADPDRFEIAPSDLFTAHRQARGEGMAVIGHYHSHPNGLAGPSLRDAEAIADPSALWLIAAVSPEIGQVAGVSAWYPVLWSPAAVSSAPENAAYHPVDYQGNHRFRRACLLRVRRLQPADSKKADDL